MKLIIEPKPYSQDMYVDTKLGRLDVSQFLKVAIAKDGRNETMLIADSSVDHATLYQILHHKGKGPGTRAVLLLLDALGYDFMLVKRGE